MFSPEIALAQEQLLSNLSYLTAEQIEQIHYACTFANLAHSGVTRKSGEPYILHPISVAHILSNMQVDADSIQAALLHDVIEDTDISKAEIAKEFSDKVAELVDGVTKLKSTSTDKKTDKTASMRKMLTATLREPRVIVIKLADRLHNMSTLASLAPEKRARIARETLDVFIPMARLVGMNTIGNKLEKLCFENLEPILYQRFNNLLSAAQPQRKTDKDGWLKEINLAIKQLNLSASVIDSGDEHYLLQDFFHHEASLDTLMLTHSFDLELENVQQCYQLADYFEAQFHWSNRTDHIRQPLPGGYQSLALNLKDERGALHLNLQTKKMRETAMLGVVLGAEASETTRSIIQASLQNLENFLDNDQQKSSVNDIVDYFHQDKLLVYTPDGDVHELPVGATVVDFAYSASLFLGNHAVGARINGVVRPLTTPLISGQTINIITDLLARPNPDWLSVVNTPKARRAIQNELRDLDVEDQRIIGEQALNRALRIHQYDVRDLDDGDWQALITWQHVESKEALFEQITSGDAIPQFIATRYLSQKFCDISGEAKPLIQGTQGIDVRHAQCCSPILGDAILGHLTKRGLVVHRSRCYNIVHEQQTSPQNIVSLNWQTDTAEDPRFSVKLSIGISITDETSTDVIYTLAQLKAGVEKLQPETNHTILSVIVRDRDHLARVIKELRLLLNFPKVVRLDN